MDLARLKSQNVTGHTHRHTHSTMPLKEKLFSIQRFRGRREKGKTQKRIGIKLGCKG